MIKKYLLLILLIPLFAFSQNDSVVKYENKWSIGFQYAPNYSFYNYEKSGSKNIIHLYPHGQFPYKADKFYFNNYSQDAPIISRAKINLLSFSIIFRCQISKKFIMKTGLDFLQLGYLKEENGGFVGDVYIIHGKISDYQLGIPILFGYCIKKKNITYEFSTGPTFYNSGIERSKYTADNQVLNIKGGNERRWLINPYMSFNASIAKKINSKLSISFGLDYKYSVLPTFRMVRGYSPSGMGYAIYTNNFYYAMSIPIGIIYHFSYFN